jgi:hypothetical protein
MPHLSLVVQHEYTLYPQRWYLAQHRYDNNPGVHKPHVPVHLGFVFFTVAPHIFGSSVWNKLHVTLLIPRFWNAFKILGKVVHPWNKPPNSERYLHPFHVTLHVPKYVRIWNIKEINSWDCCMHVYLCEYVVG